MSVETHKSEGQTACGGGREVALTLEVFRLPLFCSVLIDCCREEMAELQLRANGSIFWKKKKEESIY